jgi:hypothetical protein
MLLLDTVREIMLMSLEAPNKKLQSPSTHSLRGLALLEIHSLIMRKIVKVE